MAKVKMIQFEPPMWGVEYNSATGRYEKVYFNTGARRVCDEYWIDEEGNVVDDDRVPGVAGEKMTLRGMLHTAGLRWGQDHPMARATAGRVVRRFLESPRELSSAECDALVDEYLSGGIR